MEDERARSSVIFISEDQVERGLLLAKRGQQQLKPVSEKKTLYYFTVSHNNHYSVCEILVSPIKVDDYKNVFFRPVQRYTKCCDLASEDELKRLRQIIYDVYVRPVQWSFGNDGNKAVPLSNPPTDCDCEGHVQVGRRYLQETATIITPATRDETDSRWLSQNPSQSSDATTETDLTDTDSTRLRRNKKRGPDNSLVSTISKKSCPDMKPGSEYRFNPATVITKLLRSLEDMKKAASHQKKATSTVLNWHVDGSTGFPLLITNQEREEFANKLYKLGRDLRGSHATAMWANKHYFYNMRFLLRIKGKVKGGKNDDRASKSAVLINRIARNLSDSSKGCRCGTLVYNLFADRNNHLTRMRAGDDQRHHAADKIAQSLREKLPALSGCAYIFHPPAVIAALWNEDYETLCKQLGADNLALENPAVVKLQYSVEPELYTYAVHLEHRCPLQHGGPDGGKIDFGNLAHGKLFSPHTPQHIGCNTSTPQHIGCNTSIAGRLTQQGFDGTNGTVSVSGEPRAEGSSGRSSCRSSSNGGPSAISPVAGSQEIDDALGVFRHVGNDTPATHATERNARDNFADIAGSGITAVDVGIFDEINRLERNATDNFPEINGLERNATDNFPEIADLGITAFDVGIFDEMDGLGNTAFDGGIFEASHQFS